MECAQDYLYLHSLSHHKFRLTTIEQDVEILQKLAPDVPLELVRRLAKDAQEGEELLICERMICRRVLRAGSEDYNCGHCGAIMCKTCSGKAMVLVSNITNTKEIAHELPESYSLICKECVDDIRDNVAEAKRKNAPSPDLRDPEEEPLAKKRRSPQPRELCAREVRSLESAVNYDARKVKKTKRM